MKLRIICIGKVKRLELTTLCSEYQKRLSRFVKLDIIEYKDSTVEKESQQLQEYIDSHRDEHIILLDERGELTTSQRLSKLLTKHEENSHDITFIIGGPDGFSPELKKHSRKLALSTMTFTHEMARVLLLEQLYRAACIQHNIPYHKD